MKFDLLWPVLEKSEKLKSNGKQVFQIKMTSRKKILPLRQETNQNDEVVLEELRRLYDQEIDRRASADNKAGIYIAAITALLSILVPLLTNILDFNDVTLFSVLSYTLILLSLCGLFRAAYWANKVIKVSQYYVLGWHDILRAGKSRNASQKISEDILKSLLRNYELNNEKVTCIKMIQALMLSVTFWLMIFAVFQFLSFIISKFLDESDAFFHTVLAFYNHAVFNFLKLFISIFEIIIRGLLLVV